METELKTAESFKGRYSSIKIGKDVNNDLYIASKTIHDYIDEND